MFTTLKNFTFRSRRSMRFSDAREPVRDGVDHAVVVCWLLLVIWNGTDAPAMACRERYGMIKR